MVRNCAPENLEIPGSRFACPGMTINAALLRASCKPRLLGKR